MLIQIRQKILSTSFKTTCLQQTCSVLGISRLPTSGFPAPGVKALPQVTREHSIKVKRIQESVRLILIYKSSLFLTKRFFNRCLSQKKFLLSLWQQKRPFIPLILPALSVRPCWRSKRGVFVCDKIASLMGN